MPRFRRYFPKGIAKGEQFFDRKTELQRLLGNIDEGVHTLLLAPRRYGKSSLAKHAIQQSKLLHIEIDLFVTIDDNDIGEKIIGGVSHIIQKITDTPEQWFKTLKDYFNKSNKKWTIGIKGVNLELIPENPKTVPDNILDALQVLEHILKKKKQRAVIFIDEMQEISQTAVGNAIEGAIRHFAQESQHVVFIFSGSARHMLLKMFNDSARPLYALCDEIHLDRIPSEYYMTYLQKTAQKTMGGKLEPAVIEEILNLTDRHPRYVFILCTEVWLRCQKILPKIRDVHQAWHDCVKFQQKENREQLAKRSKTQRKLLESIALGYDRELSGHASQVRLGLTSSAIVQALKGLETQDAIEKSPDGQYRLIDPCMKWSLLLAHDANRLRAY